jgi:hypothetical protein
LIPLLGLRAGGGDSFGLREEFAIPGGRGVGLLIVDQIRIGFGAFGAEGADLLHEPAGVPHESGFVAADQIDIASFLAEGVYLALDSGLARRGLRVVCVRAGLGRIDEEEVVLDGEDAVQTPAVLKVELRVAGFERADGFQAEHVFEAHAGIELDFVGVEQDVLAGEAVLHGVEGTRPVGECQAGVAVERWGRVEEDFG